MTECVFNYDQVLVSKLKQDLKSIHSVDFKTILRPGRKAVVSAAAAAAEVQQKQQQQKQQEIPVKERDGNLLSDQELSNFYKEEGNEYFKLNLYYEAIDSYGKAMALTGPSHLLFSNRSVAYYKLEMYDLSYREAQDSVKLKKDWSKGYLRMGMALQAQGHNERAIICFQDGLNNKVSKGIHARAQLEFSF
eukprot:gene6555-7599_t